MKTASLTPSQMLQAFREKDSSFDGQFVVTVKTTGIYCRPSCRVRPPLEKNIAFLSSAKEAEAAGFRACMRCHPQLAALPTPPLVKRLIELAEKQTEPIREADLIEAGIDPTTARRQFQSHLGMSFAAYQRNRRLAAATKLMQNGSSTIDAQQAAGFESASGFREALAKLVGSSTDAKEARLFHADRIDTPLGTMLIIADDAGIVALDFVARKKFSQHLQSRLRELGKRGRPAAVVPGSHPWIDAAKEQLKAYFSGGRKNFDLPLHPIGSGFDTRAWQFLSSIPHGQTRTYGQQAAALGCPTASRAVGGANGRNLLAIVIPCHRVVGASGKLTGFASGTDRKAWLLEHEKKSLFNP